MVRSVLEYASPVWSPSTEHNISSLKKSCKICNSSVSRMINQLGWPMLNTKLILNNLVFMDLELEFNTNQTPGCIKTRNTE